MKTYEFRLSKNGDSEITMESYTQDNEESKGNTPLGNEAGIILSQQKGLMRLLDVDKLNVIIEVE